MLLSTQSHSFGYRSAHFRSQAAAKERHGNHRTEDQSPGEWSRTVWRRSEPLASPDGLFVLGTTREASSRPPKDASEVIPAFIAEPLAERRRLPVHRRQAVSSFVRL